jgi:hypothetical protein
MRSSPVKLTSTTPTRPEFLPLLASRLRQQAVPFDVADLDAWLAAVWPLVEEDPDAGRWAREYREALAGVTRTT